VLVKSIIVSESFLSLGGHGSNRLAAKLLRFKPSQAQVLVAGRALPGNRDTPTLRHSRGGSTEGADADTHDDHRSGDEKRLNQPVRRRQATELAMPTTGVSRMAERRGGRKKHPGIACAVYRHVLPKNPALFPPTRCRRTHMRVSLQTI